MRRQVKALLGWLALRTGLYRALLRQRAIIVLFHRIDDELLHDPITCSTGSFRSFCDLFGKHFEVVSLGTLLTRLERGQDISRTLAITFDDGYRDNFEIAAGELRRRGLPACFFIATAYIGTDTVAPWDAASGVTSRWMTWDQVRALRAMGFEIGAHTMHHVDLGKIDQLEAARELAGSRQRLEEMLGEQIRLFSYPFGGPDHICEQNRYEVRRAGFRCCPSAFGGLNPPGTDPFHLRRVPINGWYLSPYQFVFELLRAGPDG